MALLDRVNAIFADIGTRLDALEARPISVDEAASQPRTTIINAKGEVEPSEEMEFAGSWNGESAYDKNDVVKQGGKLWINIAAVAEKLANLIPLPPSNKATFTNRLDELRKLAKPITQYINPGEVVESDLEPGFPPLLEVFEGQNIAAVFQFRTPSKSKITLRENIYPPTGPTEGLKLLYTIYNSEELVASNFASFKEQTIEGGVKEPNLFYLVVFAVIEKEGKSKTPTITVPFVLELSSSGGLVEESLNLKPGEDETHWLEIAIYSKSPLLLTLKQVEEKLKELKEALITVGKKLKAAAVEVTELAALEGQLQLVTTANISIKEEHNNFSLSGFIYNRFTTEGVGPFNITGIVVENLGGVKILFNTGPEMLILKHESAKSSGLNRFKFSTGRDVELAAGASIWIQHNGSRWVDVAGAINTILRQGRIEAPTALAAYASGTEETENRSALVTLVITTKAEAAKASATLVNGGQSQVYEWDALAAGAQKLPIIFAVAKLGKWKVTLGGAAESAEVSRVVMEP